MTKGICRLDTPVILGRKISARDLPMCAGEARQGQPSIESNCSGNLHAQLGAGAPRGSGYQMPMSRKIERAYVAPDVP